MTAPARRALDRLLRETFEPVAREAPMPQGVLAVPDGAVREAESGWPVRPLAMTAVVVAAVVLTTAALGALGALPGQRVGDPQLVEADVRGLRLGPQILEQPEVVGFDPDGTLGPVVQVASGTFNHAPFHLLAYRGDGNCLWFRDADVMGGGGCASLPQDDAENGADFGMALGYADPARPGYVYGLVRPGVDRLWVEGEGWTRAHGHVVPLELAEIDAQAFLAFFPEAFRPTRVVIGDADGNEIGSIAFETLMSPTGGGDGPVREPMLALIIRNHSDREVDARLEEEGPQSAGSSSGPVSPCDLSWFGSNWFEGVSYVATVGGEVVFDMADHDLKVPSGQVLEILVDVRPDAAPAVGSMELVPRDESVASSSGDGRGGWDGRAASLAAALECEAAE